MTDVFQTVVRYASGPVLGAVVGYFTNYLAVKMLFHPYKPWKIGKISLPFTPGIVPRRQPELARAIGDAVGNHLFTGKDLKELFLSEETEEKIVNMAMDALDLSLSFRETECTLQTTNQLLQTYLPNEKVEQIKGGFCDFLTERIMEAMAHVDMGMIIAEQGAGLLLDKKAGSGEKKGGLGMLSMFLNEHTIQAILPPLSSKINVYIAEHGKEKVHSAVEAQVERYSDRPLHDLMAFTSEEQLRSILGVIYKKLFEGIGDHFSDWLDISSAVEKKVMAMSVKEIEALCMRVMKKELSAIINLGALIGFLIGLLGLFLV